MPGHFQVRQLSGIRDLSRLYQRDSARYPFALISSAQALAGATGKAQARYDILLAFPQQRLTLDKHFSLHGPHATAQDRDFLQAFNAWFKSLQLPPSCRSAVPFTGGWFIYCGYELAQQIEPRLQLPVVQGPHTVATAVRIPAAIIIDHQRGSALAIAENTHADCLTTLAEDYHALPMQSENPVLRFTACSEEDEAAYLQQVARIKQYIVDGDIFQANLSRGWSLSIDDTVDDAAIFRALAHANPASFAALVRLEDFSIISSSPERLVRQRDGIVETRPIAGTRPRAADQAADARLSRELLRHPKEQAEHIMLIDLERNDLGRICRSGSIHVNELLTLESWQHVHHIVSNICGKIRDGILPGDILRAVFPGGTITGCPKVRCMEILAEQEQQPRGAYTGSLGYINRDGSMDTNILIRTLVRKRGQLQFRAGGGIVADSDALAELAETRAKARGLLQAGEGAEACNITR